MNAHALDALEYDRIRSLLVSRADSAPGRERAAKLAPQSDLGQLRLLIAAVAETRALQIAEPTWGAIAFPDVRTALQRAAVAGSVLEPSDLTAIARMLQVAARVSGFFTTEASRLQRPLLTGLADRLLIEREFPRRVERSFEPSGEIRDEASPTLRKVRRELQRTRQSASGRLEGLSQGFRASGEDSFVTLRGGRYVLSVAAAEKRRLQGIVHDRSATGKTLYVEPLELVELNNALAELEADERVEIHRILREFTDWVRSQREALAETSAVLGQIDELCARARLSRDLEATVPSIDEEGRTLRIVRGRHPLLLQSLGERTVPLDLTLEGEVRGLVISGPNMGGKTVVLKTVGLLLLMALSGLDVPAADGTTLPWSDDLFVDIGDEQSLESDLSTYAARLRNMRAALSAATERSLVLFDELGAGTDPSEGAALGQALLQEIARRRSFCIASTHLGAFKVFASETDGFDNAAMEYDPQTLRPTYRLRTGLPGRSHAFELARREGWPEDLLARATDLLPEEAARADTLLERIEEELQALRQEHQKALAERARLQEDREEYRGLASKLKEKMSAIRLERALEEDRRLRELRELLAELRARVTASRSGEEAATDEALRRWFHERERRVAELARGRRTPPRARAAGAGAPLREVEIRPGQRAFARSLGVEVTIDDDAGDGRRVWVRHRGVRVAVPPSDLLRAPETAPPEEESPPSASAYLDLQEQVAEDVGGEIDLRGLDREDCLRRLELYLDRAVLAGYPSVRIIHGKGGGILRREVQTFLKSHRHVSSHRTGEAREGGWGVTIALLGESTERSGGKEKRRR